jgi:DnaJ-class molecular chaperone
MDTCPKCNAVLTQCPKCNGTGFVAANALVAMAQTACPSCLGSGLLQPHPVPDSCKGL